MANKEDLKLNSDQWVLKNIGSRLAAYRIHEGFTQVELAQQSGVGKRTLERLENGHSVQLTNMVRVFRMLNKLDEFIRILPDTSPSPMELLKLRGKVRQRASKKKLPSSKEQWQWGDES